VKIVMDRASSSAVLCTVGHVTDLAETPIAPPVKGGANILSGKDVDDVMGGGVYLRKFAARDIVPAVSAHSGTKVV